MCALVSVSYPGHNLSKTVEDQPFSVTLNSCVWRAGMVGLAPNWSDCPQMGQIRNPVETNVLKSNLKKSRICQIWGQSDHFKSTLDIPASISSTWVSDLGQSGSAPNGQSDPLWVQIWSPSAVSMLHFGALLVTKEY